MNMYDEEAIADVLAVSRDTLKTARETLVEESDWKLEGNRIAFTDDGLIRLLEHLALDLPKKRATTPDGMTLAKLMDLTRCDVTEALRKAQEGELKLYQLMVLRTTKNRHIVMATHTEKNWPGTMIDGEVRVQVHKNDNFIPEMIMPCRHIEADLWELVGRCPRFRGRW